MKQFMLLALTLGALAACGKKDTPEPEPKPTPTPEQPARPARLRGFMVARVEDVNEGTIRDAAAWGANIIRLQVCPVKYASSVNRNIWEALPVYLERIDQRLKWAKERGMKVVIDLHEPPVNAYKDPGYPAFWNDPQVRDCFIRFWRALATRFKDPAYNEIVYGYDIYNEPAEWVRGTDHVPHRWRAMAPEIVRTIRAIDRDVWIIYEPGPWNGPDNYRGLKPLADKRVMYSLHFYLPGAFTHQGVNKATRQEAVASLGVEYPDKINGRQWDKAALERELQIVDEFQRRYNVPIFVGEFSVVRWAPTPSAVRWLTDVISLFEARKWPWCYHAFREWDGWSLEHPEGRSTFRYKGDPAAQPAQGETERGKVIRQALQRNKK